MAPTVGMAMDMMQRGMAVTMSGPVGPAAVPTSAAGAGGSAASMPTANGGVAGASSVSAAGGSGGASAAGSNAAGSGATESAAGSGGGSSPAGGLVPVDAATACGENAQMITPMPRTQASGKTNLRTSGEVEFLSVKSTMIVPKEPAPARGSLFLWPGLQPLQMDDVVGYGVTQPVLSWGTSCADPSRTTFDRWWIAGVYVGTTPGSWTNISCHAGESMDVSVADVLDTEMRLEGTHWLQTMTNRSNGKTVSFSYDLKGQKQQWLLTQIELKGQTKPVEDVIFTNIVAKLSGSQPQSCAPSETGANDYFSQPRASADGKTCCIEKIILRAAGIMATSSNTP